MREKEKQGRFLSKVLNRVEGSSLLNFELDPEFRGMEFGSEKGGG